MIRSLLFLFSILITCSVMAQTTPSDSSFLSAAKKNSISVYNKTITEQSRLYNGKSYTEYLRQGEENPYFIDEWVDGMVIYDGERFEDVPLLYDISKDMVITDHQYGTSKIQLTTEKVDRFRLNNHLFVLLQKQKIADGFYELTYNGASKVYIKRQKSLQNRAVRNAIERYFIEKTTLYIKKGNNFYLVKSKGSTLNVFADHKQELKKFIRENHLKFDKDRVNSISKVAEHYDQLTHHED